ncbi:MAG: hypothetical protein WA364_30665, partial [Candidatus Nitrosopolaris sp.]
MEKAILTLPNVDLKVEPNSTHNSCRCPVNLVCKKFASTNDQYQYELPTLADQSRLKHGKHMSQCFWYKSKLSSDYFNFVTKITVLLFTLSLV